MNYIERQGEPMTMVILPRIWLNNHKPERAQVYQIFEGRKAPVQFQGEIMYSVWSGDIVFGADERETAIALMDLFNSAYENPDGRLHLDIVNDVDQNRLDMVCGVEWSEGREPGGITRLAVTFTELDS